MENSLLHSENATVMGKQIHEGFIKNDADLAEIYKNMVLRTNFITVCNHISSYPFMENSETVLESLNEYLFECIFGAGIEHVKIDPENEMPKLYLLT